jgi:hypothetical protein
VGGSAGPAILDAMGLARGEAVPYEELGYKADGTGPYKRGLANYGISLQGQPSLIYCPGGVSRVPEVYTNKRPEDETYRLTIAEIDYVAVDDTFEIVAMLTTSAGAPVGRQEVKFAPGGTSEAGRFELLEPVKKTDPTTGMVRVKAKGKTACSAKDKAIVQATLVDPSLVLEQIPQEPFTVFRCEVLGAAVAYLGVAASPQPPEFAVATTVQVDGEFYFLPPLMDDKHPLHVFFVFEPGVSGTTVTDNGVACQKLTDEALSAIADDWNTRQETDAFEGPWLKGQLEAKLGMTDSDNDFEKRHYWASPAITAYGKHLVAFSVDGKVNKEFRYTVGGVCKIPLGGSAKVGGPLLGKLYVPTKYGGKLDIRGHGPIKLFYTDGQDIDHLTVVAIKTGSITPVAEGAPPFIYEVPGPSGDPPETKYGWYYVRHMVATPAEVSNAFEQSKTTSKQPWNSWWYPMAQDVVGPKLYDEDGPLRKYDLAYGSTSWDVEKAHHFYPSSTHESMDVSWFGHCGDASASIVCEDEPLGTFSAPNGVEFTAEDKKGLLVALYHDCKGEPDTDGPDAIGFDIMPNVWHQWLEEWIIGKDTMFIADLCNTGMWGDSIWYFPVYAIEKASYKEKAGQANECLVYIECKFNYWHFYGGGKQTLEYRYDLKYSDGIPVAAPSTEKWYEVLAQQAHQRTPDTLIRPLRQTFIAPFWKGKLVYDEIKAIIPLQ